MTDLPPPDPLNPVLLRDAAINPYLVGLHDMSERLRWDLKVESWRSRARLRKLRNSRLGQKAVILCNGPSLNQVPLDSLRGVFTFGLNRIHLLFPRTGFRPSCIVATDPLQVEQISDFLLSSELPQFISHASYRLLGPRENRIYVHMTGARRRFSGDCSLSVNGGYTVTNLALQLAFHMGFDRVALVGCDHRYHAAGTPDARFHTAKTDPDHFDPGYWSSVPMRYPNLFGMEVTYRLALDYYAASGRLLVNATEGGQLEVLPRMSLSRFMAL